MSTDKETPENQPAPAKRVALVEKAPDKADGIERVREILLGDVVAEMERRLARLDHLIANRNHEVQHDLRARTDVVEAHVRKELQAHAARTSNETSHLNDAIRAARDGIRDGISRMEESLMRVEERLDGAIARVEREMRDQLLAQAKTFIEEIERVRSELRAALLREIGLDEEGLEEGGDHAGAWPAPH